MNKTSWKAKLPAGETTFLLGRACFQGQNVSFGNATSCFGFGRNTNINSPISKKGNKKRTSKAQSTFSKRILSPNFSIQGAWGHSRPRFLEAAWGVSFELQRKVRREPWTGPKWAPKNGWRFTVWELQDWWTMIIGVAGEPWGFLGKIGEPYGTLGP